MEFGVCSLSIITVRAEPSDKAEMVTQLLFGECYKIVIKKSKWLKIKTAYDNYEGWIAENQHHEIHERIYHKLIGEKNPVALDLVNTASVFHENTLIVMGSTLPAYDGMHFKINGTQYNYYGQAVFPEHPLSFEKVIEKCAMKYLNVPYLWGGRSPFGIDCSGFTQVVFKVLGIALKRDAYEQAGQGNLVDFVDLAKEGDLAFFENEAGKIVHVGIVLKEQKIIHASGKVRIDKLDHYGIFNSDIKKYSHKLKFIKRLF
jgi:gamma-D-glutamyl-L-lysine dipeptidyl-peptidase